MSFKRGNSTLRIHDLFLKFGCSQDSNTDLKWDVPSAFCRLARWRVSIEASGVHERKKENSNVLTLFELTFAYLSVLVLSPPNL